MQGIRSGQGNARNSQTTKNYNKIDVDDLITRTTHITLKESLKELALLDMVWLTMETNAARTQQEHIEKAARTFTNIGIVHFLHTGVLVPCSTMRVFQRFLLASLL
jgi:hypothetical protein